MNQFIPLILLKEFFSSQQLVRIPEEMVMSSENQTIEFNQSGFMDSALKASYLFHAYWASKTINKSTKVLDLGVGPGNQLSYIALMNPNIQFLGVDLSENMLKLARDNFKKLNIKNVDLICDDISTLKNLNSNEFDGVISSVALHHLNNFNDLENTFKSLKRVLTKEFSMYITDFLLFKNPKSVDHLLALSKDQSPEFLLDYKNSLKAAFKKKDFLSIRNSLFPEVKIHLSFIAEFLIVLKTASYPMDKTAKMFFESELAQLGKESKKIYKDLRYLFMPSGLF